MELPDLNIARKKLRNKLTPDKVEKIRQLKTDDIAWDSTPQDIKNIISFMYRLDPDLFKETKPSYKEIAGQKYIGGGKEPANAALLKKQNAAYETINKLGLAGILKDAGTKLNTAMETGYLPDVRDKNIWGVIGEGLKYPLNTVMQSLSAFPRAGAAGSQKFLDTIFEQTGLKDKGIDTIADIQKAKDTGTLPDMPKMDFNQFLKVAMGAIGQGTLESAKAAVQPLVNPKSQYANYGYANLLEKQGEGTKFTQPFKGTENWEQGNWVQRLLSGFAGKPSDIAGLAADIILDPLTYLSGGVGKGAASGATMTDDLIKAGVKVLPKEAPIALTKAGKSAFKSFFEETFPNIFKAIDTGLITPNAVSKTITATDDIAKQTAKNIIANKALNKFLQDSPDAVKYLDLGGTKMFGQTIIPGFKYAKAGKWFENIGLGKFVQKAFNAKSGIPQEFRNVFSWLESAGEAKTNEYIKAFNTITKGSNKADLDKVQKYLWKMADVERAGNKLSEVSSNIDMLSRVALDEGIDAETVLQKLTRTATTKQKQLDKYLAEIGGLSDKQQELVTNLQGFWKTVADDYVASTGKELKLYDFYTPIRYVKDEAGQPIKRTSLLGAVEQPFSKQRNITMAQAEKQGLQPKSLIENTMQRLAEQQKNVMRSRVLNEVSQFGSNVAKEGFEKVKGIPELKNMYLPKEYHKALTNVYTQFFGDDATKNFVKIFDKAQTIWKRQVLATPGYHFRNFFTDNVSGLMEYGTSFYNPKYWLNAGAIMKGEHKLITLNGVKVYADDVLKEMLETGELVTQTAVEGMLGKGGKVISKISPAELSLRVGNVRENLGRAVAGVIERDAGSSKIMAAANVKKVFFDYAHSLTPFEQNIMKRAIPFYTWMKNNLRRQVELLFTRTGKYAAIPKAMNFVENISDIPEGYKEFRPEYQQDLNVIATPFRQPGLPDWLAELLGREKTTQAGNMLGYNPNLAFQDWSRLNPKDMFSAASPFAKIPIELMANRNLFTGAEIRTGSDKEVMPLLGKLLAKLPEGAMEKLGFYLGKDGKVYTSSTMDYLLKQLPQYAIGQRTLSDTINTPYQNISTGLGIKMIPYDETQAKEQYTTNWQKEATKALNKYKTQTGTEPPSTSQINSAYKEIYTNAINEKYADVLQLKELLNVVGSSKELDSYVAELLKPYNEEINKTKDMDIQQLKDLLKSLGIDTEQLSLQDIEAILAARK